MIEFTREPEFHGKTVTIKNLEGKILKIYDATELAREQATMSDNDFFVKYGFCWMPPEDWRANGL